MIKKVEEFKALPRTQKIRTQHNYIIEKVVSIEGSRDPVMIKNVKELKVVERSSK